MPGYLIANIEVTEPAKFEEYRQKVAPVRNLAGGISFVAARCAGWKAISRSSGLWFWSFRQWTRPCVSMKAASTSPS